MPVTSSGRAKRGTSSTRSAPRKRSPTKRASTPRRASARSSAPRAQGRPSARKPRATESTRSRLETYQAKRDFTRTAEPSGAQRSSRGSARARKATANSGSFVIQKHAARSLHYDFRLEIEGVLVSWSVPKGPSTTVGEKRLAVRTEDHPLAYGSFEGTIPAGEYGAGTVEIWDRGQFESEIAAAEGLRKGRLSFRLAGERLQGTFHLVRTRIDQGKHENWLLIKGHEEAQREPESAARPASAPTARSARAKPAGREQAAEQVLAHVRELGMGVSFTNLEKIIYPQHGLRKADVIAYYASVAPRLLAHAGGRPLTLLRCPDGPAAGCFYQKHAQRGVPKQAGRVELRENDGERATYLSIRDPAGLIALAQFGVLEFHAWCCHEEHVDEPDLLVIDLDPGDDVAWKQIVQAAEELRERLAQLDLQSFVKTTGGKGLHVVAPLARGLDWEAHRDLARALVESMARDQPGHYLTNMRKDLRQGRIFLDYLRNGRGATAVVPYSLRARAEATVATPLAWSELASGSDVRTWQLSDVLARLDKPDPWQDFGQLKQRVSARARRKLAS